MRIHTTLTPRQVSSSATTIAKPVMMEGRNARLQLKAEQVP